MTRNGILGWEKIGNIADFLYRKFMGTRCGGGKGEEVEMVHVYGEIWGYGNNGDAGNVGVEKTWRQWRS